MTEKNLSAAANPKRRLALACANALEQLENRQLMTSAGSSLVNFDFGNLVTGTVLDKNGRGTGFTRVQDNTNHDAYQPNQIWLDTSTGVLKLTTTGTSTKGSNAGLDNSQTNALETSFDGTSRGFTINARLIGPFSNLNDRFEQAGIYFGADQDNFTRLVIGRNWNGQFLSFEDEFTNATGGVSSTRNGSNAQTDVGSFASINTLDVRLVGDAATGVVSAYYRINSDSGSFTKVGYDITIAANKRSTFFNTAGRAGILASNKNDLGGITATFDSFGITAGTPITQQPSVSGVNNIRTNALGVTRGTSINASLVLPNSGATLDTSTLTSSNVKLYRAGTGVGVGATLATASDGKSVVLTPKSALDPNTTFTFEVTSALKDTAGASFQPYVLSFTTGASANATDAPIINVDKPTLYFSDISNTASGGSGVSGTQSIRITNTGVASLLLNPGALSFIGTAGSQFALGSSIALPKSIEPGGYLDIPILFNAAAIGIQTGQLKITSNDPSTPTTYVNLRGLGTAGEGGNLEPSLQRILDLYQIPINDGDTTPDTTDIPAYPVTLGDGVDIQRLSKAGSGPVTIDVLGNFANSSSPSTRFGWYSPGQSMDRNQLFTVGTPSAQTVHPQIDGTTTFDPNGDFGIYGEFPAFNNRVVYSEKAFNTWETNIAQQQKVRFFPMKNPDGTVVPNTYVFAFEEYTVAFDSNDIVGIIRNVKPAATGAEIGVQNLDGVPFSDHLAFSRIRDLAVYDSDGHIPNTFHDTATLRITNSGDQNLLVSSIGLSNSDFAITNGGGSFTLAPGATHDVTVQFVYNQTGLGNLIRTGALTINSNDADEPTKVVTLSGLWQSTSEASSDGISREPTAQTIIDTFGYKVNLGTLNTHGNAVRAGEEVLSQYWNAVDPGYGVTVRQLAAFHNQKQYSNSNIRWLTDPTSTGTFIFKHLNSDGQTLLPRNQDYTQGSGTFQPGTSTFAIGIDSDYSIDARNTYAADPAAFPSGDGGHAMRFYAAKDMSGKIIPNTYFVIFDYVGQSYSNYDYQDDVYLLTNVRPASGPSTPGTIQSYAGAGGIALAWNANGEGNLAGYNVYRSTSLGGTYTKLNNSVLTNTIYTDASAAVNVTYYYQVKAVDYHGTESSVPATTSNVRTSDSTPPAPPSYPTAVGGSGGISLNWLDNTEGDLAGYNVYRASSVNGTYVKLNSSLLNSSDYTDLAAPAGATSFYRLTAVDSAGNESMAATLSAYRPSSGSVPTAPSSLVATSGGSSSVTLSWSDNSSNETGFIIERQNADGSFSQVGTASANATSFTDVNLQGGTTYNYRVRATNGSGPSGYSNESSAATTQRAPIAPTNLIGVALSGNAVRLTWTDNSTNESGYKIERRLGSSGSWTTIDSIAANLTLYTDNSANADTAYSYRVTATNSAGSSPTSNTASLTTPSAAGYTSADIGNPSGAGSTTIVNAGRDYDIAGGGTDVWSTSDQFRFVYRPVTGDFDYSARISDISQTDVGSMAGLMARESLDANSRHIYMRARSTGLRANYRDTTGGDSTGVGNIPFTFPNAWVRLQRVGNVFTAYGSTDGTTWTVVQQMTMAMPNTLYFGMAVSARTTGNGTTLAKIRDLTDRKTAVAPATPSALVGLADTATPKVTLYWNDNASNETGYRVERKLEGSDTYTTIATLGSGASTYIDSTVSQGAGYVYRVFATNSAGDSPASNELTIAVHSGVPAAPSNLVAVNAATGGVELDWFDSSSNETNFQIERRLATSVTWTSIGIVAANTTTYADTTALASTGYAYRVRALGTAGDSNYSNEISFDTPATVALTSVNVGGATGNTTSTSSTGYDIAGSGTDIWSTADQLRFAYRQVSGDFDLRVRVASLAYINDQSMAGLMVRAGLDANARNVFVKARADGSTRLTSRSSTGATSIGAGATSVTYPNAWLRLTRVGNVFTGYSSADGVTWTTIASVTMSLPTTVYVGLAVSSHQSGVTTTAQFRDLTLA